MSSARRKKKLEALKRQYGRVASAEGKDSDEAKKLSKQIEALSENLNKNQTEMKQSETQSDKLKGAFSNLKNIAGQLGSKIASGVKKSIAGLGASMATVATGAVAAGKKIYDSAKSTADYGDEVDKMSQKLGLSAKSYQEWDYVLGQAGVDITSMTTGMKTLTNQIGTANKGNKEAIERFEKLGVSVNDLKNLSREDIFYKSCKRYARNERFYRACRPCK